MRAVRMAIGVSLLLVASQAARAGDLEDAVALRAKGRLEEAAAKYRAAAADPAAEAAVIGLSETLVLLRRYGEATTVLAPALEKRPESVPLVVAKARALVEDADAEANRRTIDVARRPEVVAKAEAARACVDAALKLDPKSTQARVLDARLMHLELGARSPEERKRLEGVVADAPGDAEANYQLGMWLSGAADADRRNKDLWASAEKCLRAAFAADPANGMALYKAAVAAAWQGHFDGYVADLEKSAVLLPGDDAPLKTLVKALEKNAPNRVASLRRVLDKLPGDPEVIYYLALALNDLGKVEEARQLIEVERAKAPTSALFAFQTARLLLGATGRKDEAFAAFLKAASLCRTEADRPAYEKIDAAIFFSTQFSVEERDQLWTALVAAFPADPMAPNNAGIRFRDGDRNPELSLKWFQKALEIAPEDVMAMNDVGVAYQNLGQVDRAKECYRKAVATARKRGISRPKMSKGCDLAFGSLVKLLQQDQDVKGILDFAAEMKGDPRYDGLVSLAASLRR